MEIVRERSFRLVLAFEADADAVEAFAGGDEECFAVGAAEADVGGPGFRDVDLIDFPAGFVKDTHAAAGEVEVAFGVDGHAVRAELTEQLLVGERAIGLDIEAVGFAVADVGDEEGFAVGGADDAVGLFQGVDDADELLDRKSVV